MKEANGWFFPDDDIHLYDIVKKDGFYQKPHRDLSLSFVKRRKIAIDIGGHVGLWAKDLCENFENVIIFEADKSHISCLYKNLERFDNKTIMNVALGNEDGVCSLFNPNKSTGGNTKVDINFIPEMSISMHKLDTYNFRDISYMKIDVEGFELFVLEGAKNTILNNKPVITIEQKSGTDLYGIDRYAASKFLGELGMKKLGQVSDDHIFGW